MAKFSQELKKVVRILVPGEWTNDERGNFLEEIAGKLLKRQRYKITQRVRFTGMEIDLIADNIDTQQRVFVECKFVKSPLSANIVDLIIGQAVRKKIKIAYLFSTASLGKEAKGVLDELQQNPFGDSPQIAFVGPDKIANMFIDIYDAEPELPQHSPLASVMTSGKTGGLKL